MKRETTSATTEAIWPWRLDAPPKSTGVWKRALLQSLVAAVVATVMLYLGHALIAIFIWSIAAVLALSGIFMRSVFQKIESFGKKLGGIVAVILSWLLLVPFYYLFFWPMALLRKGRSREIFSAASATPHESYWLTRPPESSVENYRRQY